MTNKAKANHIQGTDFFYESDGNGFVTFHLNVYIDAVTANDFYGGLRIDVKIHSGLHSQELDFKENLIVSPYDSLDTYTTNIECIEGAVEAKVNIIRYSFKRHFTISPKGGFTIFAYDCCRVSTILNLESPESQGINAILQIGNLAIQSPNKSPFFINPPIQTTCVTFPLIYENNVEEPDEFDELSFALSAPYQDYHFQTFQEVSYSAEYTSTKPFLSNSPISINEETGAISGTPLLSGLYTMGVELIEKRDGIFLSRTVRDFQINASDCIPAVAFYFQNDNIVAKNSTHYEITSCEGISQISIINETIIQAEEKEIKWKVYDENDELLFIKEEKDFIHDFETKGKYLLKLIINEGMSCADSCIIDIKLYDPLNINTSLKNEPCLLDSIELDLNLSSPNGSFEYIKLNVGLYNDIKLTNKYESNVVDTVFQHFFKNTGAYNIALSIKDSIGCKEKFDFYIDNFYLPAFLHDNTAEEGCSPMPIFLNSIPIFLDDNYTITWNYGDGNTSNKFFGEHSYEEAGVYFPSVDLLSPNGCTFSETLKFPINVLEQSIADFDYIIDLNDDLNYTISLQDLSINSDEVKYKFGNNEKYTFQEEYLLEEYGAFEVSQVTSYQGNCRDTLSKPIFIKEPQVLYFPNSFSPNFDGKNETFKAHGIFELVADYQINIWNKWGELLFTSKDPFKGWDGDLPKLGYNASAGYYVYHCSYFNLKTNKKVVLKNGFLLVR